MSDDITRLSLRMSLAKLSLGIGRALLGKAGEFDESKHPRAPKGSKGGGKFAPKGGSGSKLSPEEDQQMARAAFNGWVRANVPNGKHWHEMKPPPQVVQHAVQLGLRVPLALLPQHRRFLRAGETPNDQVRRIGRDLRLTPDERARQIAAIRNADMPPRNRPKPALSPAERTAFVRR